MKLTLEAQAVFVELDDNNFPSARVWRGVTDEGLAVMAIIACVVPLRPVDQPRVNAAALRLPDAQMFVGWEEAIDLVQRRIG